MAGSLWEELYDEALWQPCPPHNPILFTKLRFPLETQANIKGIRTLTASISWDWTNSSMSWRPVTANTEGIKQT